MLILIVQESLRAILSILLLGVVVSPAYLNTRAKCTLCKFFVEFLIFHFQGKLLLLESIFLLGSLHSLLEILVGCFESALVALVIFVLHLIPTSLENIKSICTSCLVHSIWVFPWILGFHHLLVQIRVHLVCHWVCVLFVERRAILVAVVSIREL